MTTVSAVNDSRGKEILCQENSRIFLPENVLAQCDSRFGSMKEVHERVIEMRLLERRLTLYEEKYGIPSEVFPAALTAAGRGGAEDRLASSPRRLQR